MREPGSDAFHFFFRVTNKQRIRAVTLGAVRVVLLALMTFEYGCASITGSSTDVLRVNASPVSARVRIDGQDRGMAPLSVDVPKTRRSYVDVVAKGYHPASCSTQMSASGGYVAADIALCVFLFPLGCLSFIDAGGAWNTLESPQCNVELVSDESGAR
jgi:hypothetical protein